jgi:hypothetical protein
MNDYTVEDFQKFQFLFLKLHKELKAKIFYIKQRDTPEKRKNMYNSHRKWIERNKESQKEYKKQYYLKNIEQFKKRSEKVKMKKLEKEQKIEPK